ncbi:MAG TPA: TIR domain-containing protein [Blastocatellia bacterium]|nr:TIR domain-containing protein [Blastocatellia bacterium]
MDIFISWSGDRSGLIAQELRSWLPHVIQAARPFCSEDDIEKGRRWSADVAAALARTNFGVIVVLAENQNAPWLHFEAGALSKQLDESRVVPLLIDLDATDLDGPLIQFQCASFTEGDVLKLLASVNGCMNPSLPESELRAAFSKWWPDLRNSISQSAHLTNAREARGQGTL